MKTAATGTERSGASGTGAAGADVVAGVLWLALAGLVAALAWVPGLAQGNGLAVAISALTLLVAAIVASFSRHYLRADAKAPRYSAALLGLTASVIAFVWTGHAAVFALAWLVSGWLLARLIGHRDGWAEARAAQRQALRTFLIGDAALLAALGLLAWQAGSPLIADMLAAAPAIDAGLVTIIALLMLAGAAARCALPPFAGWLLGSMTAPTPVSALMHAGLVNAGGFVLLRFAPLFEAAPAARMAAIALGLFAAIYGIGVMVVRPDVKRSLAGSTVSQMGFMILSCGLGAHAAALWHIIAHGLFKAWLFLASGSNVGTRPEARPLAVSPAMAVIAAAVALAAGVALVASGPAAGNLLPLLLAGATALFTLATLAAQPLPAASRLMLVAMIGVLGAMHWLGFLFARWAVGADAAPVVPGWAVAGLLAAFLGLWLAQQGVVPRLRMPAWIYVRLVNAGALRPLGDR